MINFQKFYLVILLTILIYNPLLAQNDTLEVEWQDLVNLTYTDSTKELKKTSGGNGSWDAGAISKNTLKSNEEGFVKYVFNSSSNKMFGLNNGINIDENFSTIYYAFHTSSNSTLGIFENGVNKGNYGALSFGDELIIKREGGFIRYYKNDILLRQVITNYNFEMFIDISIKEIDSYFQDVTCSFLSPMIRAEIENVDKSQNELGSITVEEIGINQPYSYLWSDNITTKDRSNLTIGDYELFVTDSTGSIDTFYYELLYKVNWQDLVNLTYTDSTKELKKTSGGSGSWDAGAISKNTLKSNEEGFVKYVFNSSSNKMFGLNNGINIDENFSTINYAFHTSSNNTLGIFENGVNKGNYGALSFGDELIIKREGGFIRYYKNDILLRQVITNYNFEMFIDISIKEIDSYFQDVTCSFLSPMIRAEIENVDKSQNELGSITVEEIGINQPYSYLWSDNITTKDRSNLTIGDYELFVTDSTGSIDTFYYELLYKVNWQDLVNLTYTDSTKELKKTSGGSGSWDAGAISKNTLKSNEEGFVKYVFNSSSNKMFGLNNGINIDENFSTINYAFHTSSNNTLGIFENGVNKGNYGALSYGDELVIKREGGYIRYYKNDILLREMSTDYSYEMYVDFSIKTSNGYFKNLACSFDYPKILANIVHVSEEDSTGIIDVHITGGNQPYTYYWLNSEETGSSINNLTQGLYEVVAKDSLGNKDTLAFYIENQIMAKMSPAFVQDEGGYLTKHTESIYDEELMVATSNFLKSEKNYMEASLGGSNISFHLGFDSDKNDIDGNNLDFGLVCRNDSLDIIGDTLISNIGTYEAGQKILMLLDNGIVSVYIEDVLIYSGQLNSTKSIFYPKAGLAKGSKLNFWLSNKFWKPESSSEAYATLTKKLDAGYYTMLNDIKYKYKEKYNDDFVDYIVYDWTRTPVITNVQPEDNHHYGVGYHRIKDAHSYLNEDEFYTMEITNDKGEIYKMRFKFEENLVSSLPVVGPPIWNNGPLVLNPCGPIVKGCYPTTPGIIVVNLNVNNILSTTPVGGTIQNIKGQ